MTELSKKAVLKHAKKVFFKAMMDGYAGERKNSTKNTTQDGHKIITFLSDEFRLVDDYIVTPYSNKSAGTTTIYFNDCTEDDPIWWMSYGGFYQKEAIPFLKLALKKAYEEGEFWGGRGPKNFPGEKLIYVNNGELKDFSSFSGHEEISVRETDEVIGIHDYWGMSLI